MLLLLAMMLEGSWEEQGNRQRYSEFSAKLVLLSQSTPRISCALEILKWTPAIFKTCDGLKSLLILRASVQWSTHIVSALTTWSFSHHTG